MSEYNEADYKESRQSYFPITTCDHHADHMDSKWMFCTAEKAFVAVDILTLIILVCQIYIYIKINKVPKQDMRVRI